MHVFRSALLAPPMTHALRPYFSHDCLPLLIVYRNTDSSSVMMIVARRLSDVGIIDVKERNLLGSGHHP